MFYSTAASLARAFYRAPQTASKSVPLSNVGAQSNYGWDVSVSSSSCSDRSSSSGEDQAIEIEVSIPGQTQKKTSNIWRSIDESWKAFSFKQWFVDQKNGFFDTFQCCDPERYDGNYAALDENGEVEGTYTQSELGLNPPGFGERFITWLSETTKSEEKDVTYALELLGEGPVSSSSNAEQRPVSSSTKAEQIPVSSSSSSLKGNSHFTRIADVFKGFVDNIQKYFKSSRSSLDTDHFKGDSIDLVDLNAQLEAIAAAEEEKERKIKEDAADDIISGDSAAASKIRAASKAQHMMREKKGQLEEMRKSFIAEEEKRFQDTLFIVPTTLKVAEEKKQSRSVDGIVDELFSKPVIKGIIDFHRPIENVQSDLDSGIDAKWLADLKTLASISNSQARAKNEAEARKNADDVIETESKVKAEEKAQAILAEAKVKAKKIVAGAVAEAEQKIAQANATREHQMRQTIDESRVRTDLKTRAVLENREHDERAELEQAAQLARAEMIAARSMANEYDNL